MIAPAKLLKSPIFTYIKKSGKTVKIDGKTCELSTHPVATFENRPRDCATKKAAGAVTTVVINAETVDIQRLFQAGQIMC